MFEEKELQALLELISRCNIKGSEAVTVVLLQQKIKKLLKPTTEETK